MGPRGSGKVWPGFRSVRPVRLSGGVVRYGLGFVRLGQAVCQGVWEYNLVV